MAEEQPLASEASDDALRPDQVRAMRAEHEALHGEGVFNPDGTTKPLPPRIITGMPKRLETPVPTAPTEPYIEPELDRERPRPQVVEAQPPEDPKV